MLKKLSDALTREYGNGWDERQLRYCVRVAEAFPDKEILNTLCSDLNGSHLCTLSSSMTRSSASSTWIIDDFISNLRRTEA